ncbi:hypothetical protein NPIL_401661 [Nephila pilipes]|uniref:Uncharacterized protein n=1 Tax=Nephila pilipes TaxID=299642 RepID=A0A8X6QKA4_NEPPI|nr:hypothetical protein NPIL_401661 [Nephila pilipes]
MDNYKVSIEFNMNVLPNIPELCSGKAFSFKGCLDYIGDINIIGNRFNMKISKLIKEEEDDCCGELIYDSCEMDSEISVNSEIKKENLDAEIKKENLNAKIENENLNAKIENENLNAKIENENFNVEFEEKMDEDENVNAESEDENVNAESEDENVNAEIGNKDLQMEVKPMNVIPGVICMSFANSEPYEYTISNTTHYIYEMCNGNWFEKLEENRKALEITHLYAIGRNQQMYLQEYIRDIPVYLWNKPGYFNGRCSNCFRYGCSQFKTKFVLYDMFKHVFELKCEHNKMPF